MYKNKLRSAKSVVKREKCLDLLRSQVIQKGNPVKEEKKNNIINVVEEAL